MRTFELPGVLVWQPPEKFTGDSASPQLPQLPSKGSPRKVSERSGVEVGKVELEALVLEGGGEEPVSVAKCWPGWPRFVLARLSRLPRELASRVAGE